MDLPGGLSHGDSREEAVRVFQKLDYRVVRGSGHLIMSNGERRNGLAATDVGPQLDHRFTAQAVETQEGNAQQILQTLGDEGAAEDSIGSVYAWLPMPRCTRSRSAANSACW